MLAVIMSCALYFTSAAQGDACKFTTADGTCYGHQLREKSFLMADGFTNLNHGSYGTVPKAVGDKQHDYFLQAESKPDLWFRTTYYQLIDDTRAAIASFVNAMAEDVVLVENASSAVNSILRSIGLKSGDKVLHLSTAYGMVTETLNWLAQTAGIEIIIVDVLFPVTDNDQLLTAVSQALQSNPDIKLCVFSHISSMPAMIEPISELTELVRAHTTNALVLIDGAHAPGQIDVNIKDMHVDFYLGNCHKWLYAPKGTAFLWTAPAQQLSSSPEPTVISSTGYHDYLGRYLYTGTRDYTGFVTLPTSLEFRSYLGGSGNIYEYCHGLAIAGGDILSKSWGTSLLIPNEMTGYMINVILPSTDADAVAYMQDQLDKVYDIYVVYSSVQSAGDPGNMIFFTRLSAQVYLELADFEKLSLLVPTLLQEYNSTKQL